MNQVENAVVRHCAALPGTAVFFDVRGEKSKDIVLIGNDFRKAKTAVRQGKEVGSGAVQEMENIRTFK
jgi:hypothetical protein